MAGRGREREGEEGGGERERDIDVRRALVASCTRPDQGSNPPEVRALTRDCTQPSWRIG